ncbi:hypothetical protein [Candidatus Magnetominusculus dajiuhuensis]|uniref:hypothetical protein n=1 Tax=Candidatus Magnetominusculus dajiuhuensis TaxID=3137712 RepID=UPI003B431F31
MAIGRVPAGVQITAAAEGLNTSGKTVKGKRGSKPPENEKADTGAYTVGISNAKAPNPNTTTTITNETEALDSAGQARMRIVQNPNMAIGSLVFNNSRVADLMKGLGGTAAT